MRRTIEAHYPSDDDFPLRTRTMLIRHAVLDGTYYDVLPYDWHQERNDLGHYIPMAERSPSVRHGLCRVVVQDSVALLFSEGRFTEVHSEHTPTREGLAKLIKDARLNEVMTAGATFGSTGSVAFHVAVIGNRLFVTPMRTTYLTPEFMDNNPDATKQVTEKYKVKGRELRRQGYTIDDGDLASDFWFERAWDGFAETWFLPRKVLKTGDNPRVVDAGRTVEHKLGFCPMVWAKNLPGGDRLDGTCTFDPYGIENQIEMDYQMSAGGRGLKYTSSPTVVIKTDDPKSAEREHIVGDALIVPTTGDAHHLEVSGQAIASVVTFCDQLRKVAMEAMGGSRADPDKLSAAQSGRAMEMLNQSLIWLADKLRTSYGEGALIEILKMAIRCSEKYPLVDRDGEKIGDLRLGKLSLKWSPYYAPTYQDQQTQATAITTLRDGGLMSTETAIGVIAPVYDIEDVEAEKKKIDGDKDTQVDRETRGKVDVAKGTAALEYGREGRKAT